MNKIVWIIMGLFCLGCSSNAQNRPTDQSAKNDKRILVAYFSCTGTTEKVAEVIASAIDGDLYCITPAEAYTAADLNWHDRQSRSSVEMTTETARPELAGEELNADVYDVILLGYPIWWDLCPRPVNSFIEQYKFDGKTVIPFATSGGSSITNSVKTLQKLYPAIHWQTGKLLNGGPKQAADWAKQTVVK